MRNARSELIRDIMMGYLNFQGITVNGIDIVSEFENGGSCEKIYDEYIALLENFDEAAAEEVRYLVDKMLENCIIHAAIYGEILALADRKKMSAEEIEKIGRISPRLLKYID